MNKLLLIFSALLMSLGAFAQDVTLDFTTNGWGLPEGKSNQGKTETEFTNGTYAIKLAAADGYYFNTQGYLMLGKKNSTLTLPAFSQPVEKIEVVGREGASSSTKQNIYVGTSAVSTETTSSATTQTYEIAADYQAAGNVYVFKVTSSHNAQITKINIYYKSASTVESPTISGETPFSDKTLVTITVPDGTTVYYTTDGSTPSDQGDEYTDPFELTASATVKAVAYKGDEKSDVVSMKFQKTVVTTGKGTAEDPYTVADVLSLYEQGQIPTDSVYVKGKVVADVTGDDTYNNATYYISDDGTTTNQYYIFRGKYIDKANFTANDLLEAGDVVVVYGKLTTYSGTDEMAANNYIITLNGGKEGKHPKSTGDDDKGGINNPYTPEEVLALTELPATEVYIKGTVVADATGTSYNNANYYISADGTDTNQLYVYRGKYLAGANFGTDITLAKGSVVVVKGKLAVYNNANQVAAGSSIVSINGETSAINSIVFDTNANAPLYNLAGQRVSSSYKGVVVKNGKKYLVK